MRDRGRRTALLGVVAYVLAPGERRRRAAMHFRRAALEAARGVGALLWTRGAGRQEERPQRIRID